MIKVTRKGIRNMNRSEIKSYLKRQIDDNNLVVGVAVGNGRSAKQAYEGGADIILALNAGRYRMSGLPSIASFLPSSNSNELVFDFGSHEITPQIKRYSNSFWCMCSRL